LCHLYFGTTGSEAFGGGSNDSTKTSCAADSFSRFLSHHFQHIVGLGVPKAKGTHVCLLEDLSGQNAGQVEQGSLNGC
jgi:hypothetical protein